MFVFSGVIQGNSSQHIATVSQVYLVQREEMDLKETREAAEMLDYRVLLEQ